MDRFGKLHQVVVQVAGISIQRGNLFLHRFHYYRVAMPYMAYIIHAIDKRISFVVIEILQCTLYNFQRLAVADTQVCADECFPFPAVTGCNRRLH